MIKTITLSAGEVNSVEFDQKYPYFYIKNFSAADIYASIKKFVFVAGDDDVTRVPAGTVGIIYGTLASEYINVLCSESAEIEIIGAFDSNINFNKKIISGGDNSAFENVSNAVNTHINDTSVHMTTAEKEKIASLENYDDKQIKNDIALNLSSIGISRKNLFNYVEYMSKISNTNVNCGTIVKNADSFTLTATNNDCYIEHSIYTIPVSPNTQYILSWAADSDTAGYIYAFRNGDISSRQSICNSKAKQLTITTKSDTNYISIRFGVQNIDDSITYSQIMLRRADIMDNTYEPYVPSLQEQINDILARLTALEG